MPLGAFSTDVGYRYNKMTKTFERLASALSMHSMDPAVLRHSVSNCPSSFVAGLGIDVIRFSFPLGPLMVSPKGARVQLFCVFLNKHGMAVPHVAYDPRRQKYIVCGAFFMDRDGSLIENHDKITKHLGLDGYVPTRTSQPDEGGPLTCMSGGFERTKSSMAAAHIAHVQNVLKAEGDRLVPALGQDTCVCEDGAGIFYGIVPHAVPSPSQQLYPMVFAACSENGSSSMDGPG